MKKGPALLILLTLWSVPSQTMGQVDESTLGGWYMYFWDWSVAGGSWGTMGFQGDLQRRVWNGTNDLEQRLLRGGLTYTPSESGLKFTVGYGNVASGEYGPSDATILEHRMYQEGLAAHRLGRFHFVHRGRYEQRFVEDQDFRTRYRYNLFLNIPLNGPNLDRGAIYLALYNEIFINGQKDIGDGRSVEYFDRNRTYGAVGYAVRKRFKVQFGVMYQITNSWDKSQLQVSMHHGF
jgi:uncharacterized protein DUF2490